MIVLTVNGARHELDIEPETPLLWALRDEIGLTGTKYGCGIAQCGACTVHVDGQPVRSCSLSVADANGTAITTIEGLSPDASHPVQRAWIAEDVPPDHGHRGAPEGHSEPDRRRYRRQHDQYLPLRHLSAASRRNPSCRRNGEGLTSWAIWTARA
jgi:hypothetical protein